MCSNLCPFQVLVQKANRKKTDVSLLTKFTWHCCKLFSISRPVVEHNCEGHFWKYTLIFRNAAQAELAAVQGDVLPDEPVKQYIYLSSVFDSYVKTNAFRLVKNLGSSKSEQTTHCRSHFDIIWQPSSLEGLKLSLIVLFFVKLNKNTIIFQKLFQKTKSTKPSHFFPCQILSLWYCIQDIWNAS